MSLHTSSQCQRAAQKLAGQETLPDIATGRRLSDNFGDRAICAALWGGAAAVEWPLSPASIRVNTLFAILFRG
jgi:hypothetical protein